MSDWIEEREVTFRLVARAVFPEGYDGDEDGYAWATELQAIHGEVLAAIVKVLERHPAWKARGGNRGRPPEEEATLILERRY